MSQNLNDKKFNKKITKLAFAIRYACDDDLLLINAMSKCEMDIRQESNKKIQYDVESMCLQDIIMNNPSIKNILNK